MLISRNSGLLVIDEEQRFGVTHKETLKKLRTEVDVLTFNRYPHPSYPVYGVDRCP